MIAQLQCLNNPTSTALQAVTVKLTSYYLFWPKAVQIPGTFPCIYRRIA